MNIENRPNLSVEYGNGIGKVEFNPRKFSLPNLRRMVQLQLASTDCPRIEFTYRDGKTKTMGQEDMRDTQRLDKRGLSRFVNKVVRQMDKAARVSIIREVEFAPHHLHLSDDPIVNFVENYLDSLDAI